MNNKKFCPGCGKFNLEKDALGNDENPCTLWEDLDEAQIKEKIKELGLDEEYGYAVLEWYGFIEVK